MEFLSEEFIDMINKGQWVLLPALVLLEERNLRVYPLGVPPQIDHRSRTICDYSFFLINDDTFELCPEKSMQFGHPLLHTLHQIACSDPQLGPVFLYRISIRADDVPKLGIVSPTQPGEEPWIGHPLVLPMGFTAATKTVADLANARLLANNRSYPHRIPGQCNGAKSHNDGGTRFIAPSSIASATDTSMP
jgi:hypothetical protein